MHGTDRVVRVVMTADNHLSAYTPKLSPQRLAERRRRLDMAFKRTVDEAIARHVHLFIQAGDLFDSLDPRNREREFVAEQLARLRAAGVHVFAASGNHDTPRQRTAHGGSSPQGVYDRLGGLHYFAEAHRVQPVALEVAGLRLAIAGLSSNPGAPPGSDPLDGVQLADPEGVLTSADLGILILHAAIEGHGYPGEAEMIVRRSSLDRLSDFQIILAGHVHAFASFQVGNKAVVVCGATERMEFGQAAGAPGFAYLELTSAGLHHAEHIPIAPQPRHVVTIRTTELWPSTGSVASSDGQVESAGVPSNQDPTDIVKHRLAPFCTADAMVRLRLEGPVTRDQYRSLDLYQIWLYGQQRAFSFEIDESSLFLAAERPEDAVSRGERVAPRDMLEQVLCEWIDRAATPAERALLAQTRTRILACYDALMGGRAGQ
jgi:exonuclease SbcD